MYTTLSTSLNTPANRKIPGVYQELVFDKLPVPQVHELKWKGINYTFPAGIGTSSTMRTVSERWVEKNSDKRRRFNQLWIIVASACTDVVRVSVNDLSFLNHSTILTKEF